MARVSPAAFACVASGGKLKYAKHWRQIDKSLMKIFNGETKRLIINIPPQFGKSELVSKHFPAWYLGENPTGKIILTSYESNFAASWGIKARELYRQYAPQVWGTDLSSTLTRADWWGTSFDGYMATGGVQAAITGKGANILIVDDPHKNASEAHSKLMRDKIWDNYMSTLLTRLQPDGSVILIQTRWHADDLTGRLLEHEGDKWDKIVLPAIDDNGESLFPERYTVEELDGRRKTMGDYMFNALYQQRPAPKDGGMFKRQWVQYYDVLPRQFDRVIQSWDLTFGDTGDSYVVGLILGKFGASTYIIDMYRGKWAFPRQVQMIRAASEKYPQATRKLIELKANGAATIATLRSEMPGIIPIVPKESKEARASAVSYIVEAGNLYIPSYGEAKAVAENELLTFPNGSTDDFVDSLTQGLNYLYTKSNIESAQIDI